MSGTSAALVAAREADAAAASAVKSLQVQGNQAEARERYAELVARHQRRAGRIAYHYLRDAAEADEAVQDAFVKAYSHLPSFREELPFDVWFTRILINGCLDRIKARTRRERWLRPDGRTVRGRRRWNAGGADLGERVAGNGPSPEQSLLGQERRREIAAALAQAAGAAAVGVRAQPRRGAHLAGGQRDDRPERVDGAGALVPGDPETADAARGGRNADASGSG